MIVIPSFLMDYVTEEGSRMDWLTHCDNNKTNQKNEINSLNNTWNDYNLSQNHRNTLRQIIISSSAGNINPWKRAVNWCICVIHIKFLCLQAKMHVKIFYS